MSLDFNVIENLWNIIDRKLTSYHPTTVYDLQQLILQLWEEIPIETCENLVKSMHKRIQTCICVKGGTSSKY